jgi:mannose-6-phosphate isomerase-like protein (cupin superfamily)/heme-degrading monooxygenase HmoA
MRLLYTMLLAIGTVTSYAQLPDRIITNDPSKYRELSAVHAGAGKMGFTQLIGRTELSSNFLYLHAGVINSKSGIGHHFHHGIEEMYVLLNGEAEFTVNGRTSRIKAPAVIPCKMGDSHAIYNSTSQPVRWLNFAVSEVKGKGDAFDLGDTRVGVALDPIPVFVSARLERDKLKEDSPAYPGSGVLYRSLLGPDVFRTDWNNVGHVVVQAGKSSGPRQATAAEEVYYVVNGTGKLTIGSSSLDFKAGDSFFVRLGEGVSIANGGNEDLELLVISVAPSKQKGLAIGKPLPAPKALVLQMDFIVAKENAEAFEKMYYSIYVPAMTVQRGYLQSKLLRMFPENLSKEIQAEPSAYNYQIQISFDTEENRRKWVASSEHQIAWPAASKLAKEFKWRGYDVMGDDYQP